MFLSIVIFVSSCTTTSNNSNKFVSSQFGVAKDGKQACKGNNTQLWHNCYGVIYTISGRNSFFRSGTFMNGKREGKSIDERNGFRCYFTLKNGLKDGWNKCDDGRKEFWVAGKLQSSNKSSKTNKQNISVNLTRLTNSVMNGWRGDYKAEMGSLINGANCSSSVNLTALTNSVMNKWRADYKSEMGSLLSCTSCSSSVNLTTLTNSVMNGWRADYKNEMSSLISCASN